MVEIRHCDGLCEPKSCDIEFRTAAVLFPIPLNPQPSTLNPIAIAKQTSPRPHGQTIHHNHITIAREVPRMRNRSTHGNFDLANLARAFALLLDLIDGPFSPTWATWRWRPTTFINISPFFYCSYADMGSSINYVLRLKT